MSVGGGAVARVQGWVLAVMERLAWMPTTATILLPVVAAVLFVFKGDLKYWTNWALLVLGVLCLLLNALVQAAIAWWGRQNQEAEIGEANHLRVAMKDALQPLAELIATMPYANKATRIADTKTGATHAVGALVMLKKDVDRARAVVYALDPTHTRLQPLAHAGRGSTPSEFVTGNVRGDRAIGLVKTSDHLFVPDLDAEVPANWEGSGSDYRTFISAAITAGKYSYGMLTLDAPKAGDLSENDMHTVLLVADLLAIAFAEADR